MYSTGAIYRKKYKDKEPGRFQRILLGAVRDLDLDAANLAIHKKYTYKFELDFDVPSSSRLRHIFANLHGI